MVNRKKRVQRLAIAASLTGLLVWAGGCATGQTISLSALASIGGQQTEGHADGKAGSDGIHAGGSGEGMSDGKAASGGIHTGGSGGGMSNGGDRTSGSGVLNTAESATAGNGAEAGGSSTADNGGVTTAVNKGENTSSIGKSNEEMGNDQGEAQQGSETSGKTSSDGTGNAGSEGTVNAKSNGTEGNDGAAASTEGDGASNDGAAANAEDGNASNDGSKTSASKDSNAASSNGSQANNTSDNEEPSVKPSTDADDAKEQKLIALTFDDGPDLHYTTAILDILKEKGVHATFFEVGLQIEKYPEVLKRIRDEGHAIGNHTQDHKDLSKLTEAQIIDQMKQVDDEMKDAIGEVPTLFRAPYGAVSDTLKKVMEDNGRRLVGWNIDTRDWAGTSIKDMREMIRTKAKPNAIILMHSFGSKNIQHTVDMLADVIDDLQKQGYTLVTVDQIPEK
ncbi:polysaccharide deacetylase family protein [Paenibacillus sp. HB172176]|uniref:polysaccharide deacetylase family protein n=1 Tax=Paenibacillus sp. HB172176 TaxID=2493690 RepID=UPI00143BA7B4|nr:polysaccharide deacetylase family protein [Paenibacillus sp. HB172176]